MTFLRNSPIAVKLGAAVLGMTLCAAPARATDFVYVANAAQLAWQQTGNLIYFRNLHEFDPTFLGCCYNFHLDLTTVGGCAGWTAALMQMAASQPIYLGVASKSAPSAVNYIGNF